MLPKIDFEIVDSFSQSDQIKILFNAMQALYERIAIYEKNSFILSRSLQSLEETVKTEIGGLKEKVDSLEIRFDSLETRFDNLETRFDTLESKVDSFENKFDNFQVWIKDFLTNTLEDRIKKSVDKKIYQHTINCKK